MTILLGTAIAKAAADTLLAKEPTTAPTLSTLASLVIASAPAGGSVRSSSLI